MTRRQISSNDQRQTEACKVKVDLRDETEWQADIWDVTTTQRRGYECNESDSPQWDRSGLGPHGAVIELVAGHSNHKHSDAVRVVRGKSTGIVFGGRAMPVQGQQGGSQQPLSPV